MSELKKVFITKYVLTQGMREEMMEVEENPEHFKKSCFGKTQGGYMEGFYNDDFHLTKEEALADAEKRRVRKIESLKKQISKLEKMSFE